MTPTRFADIGKPECEARQFKSVYLPASVGRNPMIITCPFCDDRIRAYLWSLCGGGKRCTCGAIFGGHGTAYKLKDTTT